VPDRSSPQKNHWFDLHSKGTCLRHHSDLQQDSFIYVHVRQMELTNSAIQVLKQYRVLCTDTFMLCMTHDGGIELTVVLYGEEAWFRFS
jgi:hypothetical protein